MKTKTYSLPWENVDCLMAIRRIEMNIPCFTLIRDTDDDWYEVTITCREEDVVYVERELAPYV